MDHFTRGPLRFDVRDSGPADGAVVVLLHGFPQDGSCWDGVARRLNQEGLRTLVPDQRGFSPGARPPGRRPYTLEHYADDVLALLDAAGVEKAHLAGHDWGGAVAWHLAGRNADRIHSLTAVSTPHAGAFGAALRGGGLKAGTQARRSWYMAALAFPAVPERVLPARIEGWLQRSGLPAGPARAYADRLATPAAARAAMGWYRALPFSGSERTHRSRIPTTYVWGRRDPFFSRRAAEGTAGCVKAPYVFCELDAGHWLPESRPAEVADLMLARISSPDRDAPPPVP